MFMCIESWRSGTEEHLQGNYSRNDPGDLRLVITDGGFRWNKGGKTSSKLTQTTCLGFCFFSSTLSPVMSVARSRSGVWE